jgi:hypothetical protein
LTSIKTRVAETVRFAKNQIAQDTILSKSMRGKFSSNVGHTKPKVQQNIQEGAEAARGGGVFRAHNKSPITKLPGAEVAVSKAKIQAHPGKATAKTDRKFCKWCGVEVGGTSVQLLQIAPKSPFLTDMSEHETKTTKHTENVRKGIEHVKCTECSTIHPNDMCRGK